MPDDLGHLDTVSAITITYDRDTGRFEYDLGELDDFAAHALLELVTADVWDRLPWPRRADDPETEEEEDDDGS